jgi:hypothetical protein
LGWLIVGYSAKEQKSDAKTGIISFQWDSVNGDTITLNSGFIKPTVPGTIYEHGTLDDPTPGWYNNAPKIQIRKPDGGYTVRYYADDIWDDTLCAKSDDPDGDGIVGIAGWADSAGGYDATTTLSLGGGAWINSPDADNSFTTCGMVATEEVAVGGDSSAATLLCGGAFPVAFQLNNTNSVVWTCTPGTIYEHGANDDPTKGWYNAAPSIQVRTDEGGYILRYYADDIWDDTLCAESDDPDGDGIVGIRGWADAAGGYDSSTTVAVGGGFWLKSPTGDKKIYVTVKNPVK